MQSANGLDNAIVKSEYGFDSERVKSEYICSAPTVHADHQTQTDIPHVMNSKPKPLFFSEPEERWDDQGLLEAFNIQFFTELTMDDIPRIKRWVQTAEVRPWYDAWLSRKEVAKRVMNQSTLNSNSSVPQEWRDLGVTVEQWNESVNLRRKRREARRIYNEECAAIAMERDRKQKLAKMALDSVISQTETPLVTALDLGPKNLDRAAIDRVNNASVDLRGEVLTRELAQIRLQCLHGNLQSTN